MARVNPRKPKYPVIYPPRRPNTGPTPVPFPQTPASGHSRPIPSHTSGETVSEHLTLKEYFKHQLIESIISDLEYLSEAALPPWLRRLIGRGAGRNITRTPIKPKPTEPVRPAWIDDLLGSQGPGIARKAPVRYQHSGASGTGIGRLTSPQFSDGKWWMKDTFTGRYRWVQERSGSNNQFPKLELGPLMPEGWTPGMPIPPGFGGAGRLVVPIVGADGIIGYQFIDEIPDIADPNQGQGFTTEPVRDRIIPSDYEIA